MPDINPSIPVAGLPNSSEEPKIVTALTQLVAAVNDIDNAQIAAAAGIVDTKLASPNNAVWRTLQTWDMAIPGLTSAGLYSACFRSDASFAANGASHLGTRQYQVSATDSAVAGKTTKYRWAYNYETNGVAPAAAITLDVRAVTGTTGSTYNAISTLTLGAAQPGPAVTFTPSVPGSAASASTGVAIADGTYTLGITLAGATASTAYLFLSVSLQVQHV